MTRCTSPFLPPWAFTLALVATTLVCPPANAQGGAVYRCPSKIGGADEFTNLISEEQARERGCRTIEGAPITVIQGNRPRVAAAGAPRAGASGANSAANPAASATDARIDPAAQRLRDADARRILEAELQREEDKFALLRRDYNNGEPERRGNEHNFQNYLDRVAQMKASINRSEADVAALKREISKLPP